MSTKEIAGEILRQLGGNKFIVMTGAKNFACGENEGNPYIVFKIGRNAKSITHVKIALTVMDDYKMEFMKVGKEIKVLKTFNGVYCDQLQELFTEATGMYTRL